MRAYTTDYIETLIEKNTPCLEDWIPQVLIPQLFDPSQAVCSSALSIIRKCTAHPKMMRSIITCKPDLDYLCANDSSILIKFLCDPLGYEYLFEAGFVDQEANYWIEVHEFVILVWNVPICR